MKCRTTRMMNLLCSIIVLFMVVASVASEPIVEPLWPEGAPLAKTADVEKPDLTGHFNDRGLHSQRFKTKPAGGKSRQPIDKENVIRVASQCQHTTHFFNSKRRGQGCPCGEQRCFLPGFARCWCAGRNAYF